MRKTLHDNYKINAGADLAGQVGIGHFYHIFYEGCLTNFEIGENAEEASKLYPDLKYKRVEDYFKRYLWSLKLST